MPNKGIAKNRLESSPGVREVPARYGTAASPVLSHADAPFTTTQQRAGCVIAPARIRERVARGGHDMPEDKVRRRHDDSRRNLLSFIGTRAAIRVWDNSTQAADGRPTHAREVFRVDHHGLRLPPRAAIAHAPAWTRPPLAQALKPGLR